MKKTLFMALLLCGLGAASISAQVVVGASPVFSGPSPVVMSTVAVAFASTPVVTAVGPPPSPTYQPLAPEELDDLLGPIALYPDPLLSEILPAAMFPSQIVMADHYISDSDPNKVDQQPWDPSVQALAHYPTVLQWMSDDLHWTTMLGDAFVNQQADVLDSIQRLRRDAYNRANLQPGGGLQVLDEGDDIEILPADYSTVCLPEYQPDYTFYRTAFPVTYGRAVPIGPWINCEFDWNSRRIVSWDRNHPRPPGWWCEPADFRGGFLAGHTTVWNHQAAHPVNLASGSARGRNNQSHAFNAAVGGRNFTPPPPVRVQQAVPAGRPAPIPLVHGGLVEPMRPQGSPVEHSRASRSTSTDAYIGIESSHDTRTYSERGEQSVQTVSRSESVSRPAPEAAAVSRPEPSMGGGGASRR